MNLTLQLTLLINLSKKHLFNTIKIKHTLNHLSKNHKNNILHFFTLITK